ncbi:hypothetical protein RFI_10783 [Reticulomyxa filosa]|uniref:Uncharacterized protein n=1 Tax=Reticulomyxa filosa TaxID=46433 RepID=X6NKV3_RETFI|nr:hypothetical protein RFI_10783 [Reticulomyxa filosa]|eukprot:ETO26354.1 hypothetical protein RFI_10783 [Reticulomyxa filosa]
MSKRKKAEGNDWSEVNFARLNAKDIRTLLQTRGAVDLPPKREQLEELLKTKDVEVEYKEEMTGKQLMAELKLRNLDNTNAKKIKSKKRGEKKTRATGVVVWVAMYLGPADKSSAGNNRKYFYVAEVF